MLKSIFSAILDVLLPAKRHVPLKRIDRNALAERCRPVCIEDIPYVTRLYSYKDADIKILIRHLKYRNNAGVASLFAGIMYEHILSELGDELLLGHFTDPLLIPVPASKERLRQYGRNHMDTLAHAFIHSDKGNAFTLASHILKKKRGIKRQTRTKSREERLLNIKGAFIVRNPREIRGRNIVLIDDVVTTGATLTEARRVLLDAGAREVRAFAIAH